MAESEWQMSFGGHEFNGKSGRCTMRGFRTCLSAAVLVLAAAPLLAASCEQNRPPADDDTKRPARPAAEEPAMKDRAEADAARPAARDVFAPQVAGRFYPGDAEKLRAELAGYLDAAAGDQQRLPGDLLGIVVPHAGTPYSGPVAGHAFAQLRGRGFQRVVVLGPAHRRRFATPALLDADAYRTPLGAIPIDRAGVRALAASGAARIDRDKFSGEHALEVELPFLQVALDGFELVPLMISGLEREGARALAAALADAFPGRDTLFVASTDLSHDFPYEVARAMDRTAVQHIRDIDPAGLYAAQQAFRRARGDIRLGPDGGLQPACAQLCGLGPVLTLLELARHFGPAEAAVLDLRNSGDIVGDRDSRIVGYAAVALRLEKPRPTTAATTDEADDGGEAAAGSDAAEDAEGTDEADESAAPGDAAGAAADYLGAAAERALLRIARRSLEAYLGDGQRIALEPADDKLARPGAAFVTLRRDGRLRGCIGHMEPTAPLWQMVRDRAIDAAVRDSRFPALSAEELDEIDIEISVLTPRQPVSDPLAEIEIGRDGVWLRLGSHRGVFLPQVPVEQGWKTVEQYLDHLCRKAHIFQRGCWRSDQAEIQRFQAIVFSEAERQESDKSG